MSVIAIWRNILEPTAAFIIPDCILNSRRLSSGYFHKTPLNSLVPHHINVIENVMKNS
jgi:hypothetical protein